MNKEKSAQRHTLMKYRVFKRKYVVYKQLPINYYLQTINTVYLLTMIETGDNDRVKILKNYNWQLKILYLVIS